MKIVLLKDKEKIQGWCNSVVDPDTVEYAENDIGDAVCRCELYLMDVDTKKILPNKKFRTIDYQTGRRVLGTSDANGKIDKIFDMPM